MFRLNSRVKKKIEDEEDCEPTFELTTELLMLRALERGLSLNDFENLTVGMILDYIIEYNNEHLEDDEREDTIKQAGQYDFDMW